VVVGSLLEISLKILKKGAKKDGGEGGHRHTPGEKVLSLLRAEGAPGSKGGQLGKREKGQER